MIEAERVAREFYRRIGGGDVRGILELLSDNVTWTIPGPTAIPYAGTFHGKDGVAEFFRLLYLHERLEYFVATEFIVDGELGSVCVLGHETAISIVQGRRFSTRWVEVFRVSGSLITAFEEYIDTFALASAYGSPNFGN